MWRSTVLLGGYSNPCWDSAWEIIPGIFILIFEVFRSSLNPIKYNNLFINIQKYFYKVNVLTVKGGNIEKKVFSLCQPPFPLANKNIN